MEPSQDRHGATHSHPSTTRSWPEAVVFDCDGTLVDSETATLGAMRAVLATLGHSLTEEQSVALVGHTWPRTRSWMVREFGLTEADLATYRRGVQARLGPRLADPDIAFDDASEVVGHLDRAGVPLAVCTSSGREHLAAVLRLPPYEGVFAASVTREDTHRHKPDPLPYLTAIERLGAAVDRRLAPASVTVVEDSTAGVAAAVAAGCWTVAVDRGLGHDLSAADLVVSTLALDDLVPRSGGAQVRGAG